MKIRMITSTEDFAGLEQCWNETLFCSGHAHVQSTYEWLFTWWKIFGKEARLFILVAEDNDGIAGIAPLMIHKVGKFYRNMMKFNRLSFLGVGLTDNADFIIVRNREEVLKSFFAFIYENKKSWDEINLKQVNSSSPQFHYLENGMLDNVLPIDKELQKSFEERIAIMYLDTTGDFDEYYHGLALHYRKSLNRYIKHTADPGEISFEVFDCMDEQVFNEIFNMNRQRNEGTGRRSIFLDEKKFAFIKEVLPLLSAKGWVKIFVVKFEQKIIAYQIDFSFMNVIYAWNTSFDIDYSDYSPGRILMCQIIKYCHEHGYEKLNLMAGSERYKYHWTKTMTNNFDFMLRKKNLKTEFSLMYEKFKYRIKAQ